MTKSLLKPWIEGEDIKIKITVFNSLILSEDNYISNRGWVCGGVARYIRRGELLYYVFRKRSQLMLVTSSDRKIDIIQGDNKSTINVMSGLYPKKYVGDVFTIDGSRLTSVTNMVDKYKFYLSILGECNIIVLHKLYKMPLKEKFFKNWIRLITGDEMIELFIEKMNCLGLHDIKFIY